MPEILTNHPDIVLRVLKGVGIHCGDGAQQNILKSCPPQQFCSLATGELCVYGIQDIPKMTQISSSDLAPFVNTNKLGALFDWPGIISLLIVFAVGLLIGLFAKRLRKS